MSFIYYKPYLWYLHVCFYIYINYDILPDNFSMSHFTQDSNRYNNNYNIINNMS